MKYKPLLISVIISLMIASCQKQNYTESLAGQQPFLKEAIQFLQTQVSEPTLSTLNTSSPNLVQYQGNPVAVRVYPAAGSSSDRFILLYKKEGRFTGHWVDLTALNKARGEEYEGTVSLLNLKDALIKRYTVQENKVTGIYDAVEGRDIIFNIPSLSSPDNPQELDAFVVGPRRSYNNIDYFSAYWLSDQYDAYEKEYIPLEEYRRNGGGESNTEIEVAVVFAGPDHPIKDIKEELKCFTIDPKAVYSVTVNVNQPVPGTRELVNLKAEHNVGHVFLTLQELQADGTIVVRNVGFYPLNSAKPWSPSDVSTFGDDSETTFSVSLKISVSSNEFNNIQSIINNTQKSNYNLQSYNCTTMAIDALTNINVNLPATLGKTKSFKGNDPADLGEDIRALNLNSFSVQNGGRQVIRSVSNDNIQLSPNRTANCK